MYTNCQRVGRRPENFTLYKAPSGADLYNMAQLPVAFDHIVQNLLDVACDAYSETCNGVLDPAFDAAGNVCAGVVDDMKTQVCTGLGVAAATGMTSLVNAFEPFEGRRRGREGFAGKSIHAFEGRRRGRECFHPPVHRVTEYFDPLGALSDGAAYVGRETNRAIDQGVVGTLESGGKKVVRIASDAGSAVVGAGLVVADPILAPLRQYITDNTAKFQQTITDECNRILPNGSTLCSFTNPLKAAAIPVCTTQLRRVTGCPARDVIRDENRPGWKDNVRGKKPNGPDDYDPTAAEIADIRAKHIATRAINSGEGFRRRHRRC